MIKKFRDNYFFLSNFYECPVTFAGITYTSSESAFQAQKCLDESVKQEFSYCSPANAKSLGFKVPLRPDWEEIKVEMMYQVCKAKFEQNPELLKKLLNTGVEYLCEGNTWNDKFWGKCHGKGKNMLGLILMKLRKEFQNYKPIYYHEVMFYPSLQSICIRSYSDNPNIKELEELLVDDIKTYGDTNIENIFPLSYHDAHSQFNMKNEDKFPIF